MTIRETCIEDDTTQWLSLLIKSLSPAETTQKVIPYQYLAQNIAAHSNWLDFERKDEDVDQVKILGTNTVY